MRTLSIALAVAVAVAIWTCPAAFDVKAAQRNAGVGLADRIQDLNLTDEQEAKIADVRKEFQPKVRGAAKELADVVKEEVEKVRAVLTPEQKEKLQTLKEERRELRAERLAERIAHLEELDLTDGEMARIAEFRKEYRPKVEKALEGLRGILTDDQRKIREDGLKEGKRRREVIASLKLTEEQKGKLETIGKELRSVVHEELEKMRDVLTESQKEKLAELKDERKDSIRDRMAARIANFKELNLTDEQKTKIAEFRKEYRPKVQEAGNKLRATIRQEVDMILAVIKG
jgi:Spy/CpxP family protein refolding chaperone